MTETEVSPLISSATLARDEGVTRATIARWRRVGYLPRPVYFDRHVTLWSAADIALWREAGCPWANSETAKEVLAEVGRDTFNQMTKPEPWTETALHPRIESLVDRMETLLNSSSVFVVSAEEFAKCRDHYLAISREAAIHHQPAKDK